jgi:competence protein ComEC
MYWWPIFRKIHVSWLIGIFCFGVIVGVIFIQYIPSNLFASSLWVITGLGLCIICLWQKRMYLLALMFIAGSLIGLYRGSIAATDLTIYKNIIGHNVILTGKVSEDVDKGKNGELILRLSNITTEKHELPGTLWITSANQFNIKRSDIVEVSGLLLEGFGSFSGTMYRADINNVFRPEPGDVAGHIRDWFAGSVKHSIGEPEASLGIGFLTGQRRSLPEELDSALRIAGLMHIVVASGYNLTILVRLARRLFVNVSKYLAAFSGLSMIIIFIAITGLSPSMSRAGLVSGLSLLAWYYGRKFHPMVLLPLVGAITLLITPSYGWNDLGWQLSFAAFAGVMILAPLANRYFYGDIKPGFVRQVLVETLAAQIVTLPILVLAFGQFSNVATFANLLIVPFIPIAMLLTFFAGIVAIIVPSIASLVGFPAAALLNYMINIAEYTANLSWAQTTLSISIFTTIVYYAAVIGACLYMWHVTKLNLREESIVE